MKYHLMIAGTLILNVSQFSIIIDVMANNGLLVKCLNKSSGNLGPGEYFVDRNPEPSRSYNVRTQ